MRAEFAGVLDLYFGGDMEAAVPLTGQVCGRIDEVLSVSRIIQDTVNGFREAVGGLSRYVA